MSLSRYLLPLCSAALACLVVPVSVVSAWVPGANGYDVTQQSAAGQLPSVYTGLLTRQTLLGPFPSRSAVEGPNDDGSYASWWQIPVQFPVVPNTATPFVFPFYGVNYTSVTATSKGVVYLGSYSAESDLHNLATTQHAPDYSVGGAGLPLVDGVARPAISFMHGMGGAVSSKSLVGGAVMNAAAKTAACLAYQGPCSLSNYQYTVMAPIATTNTAGVLKTMTPINSVGTTADGTRFVLSALALRSYSGVAMSVITVLYASGLFEVMTYQVAPDTTTSDSYTPNATPGANIVGTGADYASIGAYNGTGVHTTLAPSTFNVVQQSYNNLYTLAGTTISFRPKPQQ